MSQRTKIWAGVQRDAHSSRREEENVVFIPSILMSYIKWL